MKKLALTSLMAVFAVSGAHAANVIDGNPLYMPGQNHFYSVTELESHTKNNTPWGLNEEFGYGILDNLAISVETSLSENNAFDEYAWNDVAFNLTYRALDMNGWKLDVMGAYGFSDLFNHPKPAGHDAWFDKGMTEYAWMAGIRGGYVGSNWTVAGRAEFAYLNTESFNWNDDGGHAWTFGVDGQYVMCNHLSLVGTVEYTGWSDSWAKNDGEWFGEFGVNYNFDATKFAGLYINGSLNHHDGSKADEWGWDKGFGYGIKFGVDF